MKEGSESPRRNKEGAGRQETRGRRLSSQIGDIMMMSSQVWGQEGNETRTVGSVSILNNVLRHKLNFC